MELIKQQQANLVGVIIALDRQEKGTGNLSAIQQVSQDYNVKVFSIVTVSDVLEYLKEKGGYDQVVQDMIAYRDSYGVLG